MPRILLEHEVSDETYAEIMDLLEGDREDGDMPSLSDIEESIEQVSSGISVQDVDTDALKLLEIAVFGEGEAPTFESFQKKYPKDSLIEAAKDDPLIKKAIAIVYDQFSPEEYDTPYLQQLVKNTVSLLAKG